MLGPVGMLAQPASAASVSKADSLNILCMICSRLLGRRPWRSRHPAIGDPAIGAIFDIGIVAFRVAPIVPIIIGARLGAACTTSCCRNSRDRSRPPDIPRPMPVHSLSITAITSIIVMTASAMTTSACPCRAGRVRGATHINSIFFMHASVP